MSNNNQLLERVDIEGDEVNKLCFKLEMTGMENVDSVKPKLRFTVIDPRNGLGICCPVKPIGEGVLEATIPPLGEFLMEGQDYHGNLEVVFGTRIFTPATLMVRLVAAPKVVLQEVKLTTAKKPAPTTELAQIAATLVSRRATEEE
jgi:hypothetical protein